jgi:hypothetical protein
VQASPLGRPASAAFVRTGRVVRATGKSLPPGASCSVRAFPAESEGRCFLSVDCAERGVLYGTGPLTSQVKCVLNDSGAVDGWPSLYDDEPTPKDEDPRVTVAADALIIADEPAGRAAWRVELALAAE